MKSLHRKKIAWQRSAAAIADARFGLRGRTSAPNAEFANVGQNIPTHVRLRLIRTRQRTRASHSGNIRCLTIFSIAVRRENQTGARVDSRITGDFCYSVNRRTTPVMLSAPNPHLIAVWKIPRAAAMVGAASGEPADRSAYPKSFSINSTGNCGVKFLLSMESDR